jgi:RHS repeat-associated protein
LGYENADGTFRNIVLASTTYDAAGNVTGSTSGGGLRTESYQIAESGLVTSSTLDPGGLDRTTSHQYDPNGNVTVESITDGTRTETVTRSYDAGDRVTSEIVENGADDLTTTYQYDNRGALTSTVDPRGNAAGATAADYQVTFEIDALGRTTRTVSPAVSVTEAGSVITGVQPDTFTGYDTFGQTTHHRDERGNETEQQYDRLGRVVTITHPTYTAPDSTQITPTEVFQYDDVGNLTQRTDRRGEVTMFAFDGLNRPISQTDPAVGPAPAGVFRTFYDDAGNTIATVDQIGARVEYVLDDLNRVREQTVVVRKPVGGPDRFTTTNDYDDLGNLISQTTPSGDTSTYLYSPASELTEMTDAELNTTQYEVDLRGRQTSVQDPLGRFTETDYDLAGRVIETRQLHPTTGVTLVKTTADYDPAGNLVKSVGARGYEPGNTPADFTTEYEYDPLGHLTNVVQPVSATESISTSNGYDRAGNLTATTNGEQRTTYYGYNEWNLQHEVTEPATTAHPTLTDRTWTTTFDAAGLPIGSDEPGGVAVSRVFDDLGRMVTESGTGVGAPAATRTFDYDAAGRMTSAGSPDGNITFDYDDRDLLTSSTGPAQVTATFEYDESGRMDTRIDAAGTSTYEWTPRNQLETITDALTGTTRTHTFNAAGQLDQITYSGGATRDIEYDDLGRIASDELLNTSSTLTASYEYGYDADGYMTTRSVNLPGNPASGINIHTYDNAGRLLSWSKPDTTTVNYEWDDAGNLTSNAGVTITYDERNRVTADGDATYTWTPRGTLASVTDTSGTITHTFDALGRAVDAASVTYSFDSLDRITTDGTATFGYAGLEIDPVQVGDLTIARTPGGLPAASQQGAATPVLLGRNSHGDIGFHHDASGTVTATRSYDPLGAVIGETGSLTPFGFQGDYTDATTGDVWMGARWYRPGTTSFTSRDTVFGALQTPVSLNRYTYAWANPTGMWDPDGHCPKQILDDWGTVVCFEYDEVERGAPGAKHFGAFMTPDYTRSNKAPTGIGPLDNVLDGAGDKVMEVAATPADLYDAATNPKRTVSAMWNLARSCNFDVKCVQHEVVVEPTLQNYRENGFWHTVGTMLPEIAMALASAGTSSTATTTTRVGRTLNAVEEAATVLDDIAPIVDDLARAPRALPAGSPGRVVANALEPHELAQAQSVVGYRGGTLVGNSARGAPGIDGMLDGVPASLKTYSGSSPAGVLRHVSQAEASASKAGYSGVQVFVDAPGVSRSTLVDFGANGPLSQIPTQGTVGSVYVRTADGWVAFPG